MRRRLLDATVECLVQHGYTATTTTRVTAIAGVTRGAQVHHFPTRADLVAAAVRYLMEMRMELAIEKIDAVRQAIDPIDAALDLLWEVHHGPNRYAILELWMAARTDPELRERITEAEPAARGAVAEYVLAAFADHADLPRFRQVVHTAIYTVRGVLLTDLPVHDAVALDARWQAAKADLRRLIDDVIGQVAEPINGAR